MKWFYALFMIMMAAGTAFAGHVDMFFFNNIKYGFCVSKSYYGGSSQGTDGTDYCESNFMHDVRIRVIDPQANSSAKYGFDVARPFLIVDGIYLSTDGTRTLEEFHEEANQFGLPSLLSELGYTPVLVQFSETVQKSLSENASYFMQLLRVMNSNKLFGMANKEDGFVVMGISQGGIIGRYGSYMYDLQRASTDAPIRMFASLDSPHQGAVMPLGLFYSINFWATNGGSAEAEAFADLIDGPGASDLLLYEGKGERENRTYAKNTSADRFLFGLYRKAAEYKKFPTVLVSQGQLKGSSPKHSDTFYKLSRKVEKLGAVVARATSNLKTSEKDSVEIAYNRRYRFNGSDRSKSIKSTSRYDFVQGSTYPFAETLYESLREGMLDAIPNGMSVSMGFVDISLNSSWTDDSLYQKSSTFIPTVSAMDLKCSKGLAIDDDCAFTQTATGLEFDRPGTKSSGAAMYAVDETHPRYKESISGRHIELPTAETKTKVLDGIHVDMWRVLCNLSKIDYDKNQKTYRNPNLAGIFDPNASCMDQSKMPEIVKQSGQNASKRFAYARYDYNKEATEKTSKVVFDVPAGWHKVAVYDHVKEIPSNGAFAVDILAKNVKNGWLKAELLVTKTKGGTGQLQLEEIDVPLDGKTHTLRWQMPSTYGPLTYYEWFRLVINTDGANITLSNARFETNTSLSEKVRSISSPVIYPNTSYTLGPWLETTTISDYRDNSGAGFKAQMEKIASGFYIKWDGTQSLQSYKTLKVAYWPGTCSGTKVYFDSFAKGGVRLRDGKSEGNFVVNRIPLSEIVNTEVTAEHKVAASRLSFQSTTVNEVCAIHEITLEK
ncbi:MAG: hypothetical protein HUK20_09240 [Fibrobacter sp.]|nr:hypothetical protein [Fibrobacter sp.]